MPRPRSAAFCQARSGHPRGVRHAGSGLARTREKLQGSGSTRRRAGKSPLGRVSPAWRWPSPTAAGWMASTLRRSLSKFISPAACPVSPGRPTGYRGQGSARPCRAAIFNSGFEFPSKRITVNLAPADLPKESGRFDLPIALGILAASGQIPDQGFSRLRICRRAFALRRTAPDSRGAGHGAANCGQRQVLHPARNQRPRGGTDRRPIHPFRHARYSMFAPICATERGLPPAAAVDLEKLPFFPDLSRGARPDQAKRAWKLPPPATFAVDGRPARLGKSMLAARLPGLMPALDTRGGQGLGRRALAGRPFQAGSALACAPTASRTIRPRPSPWSAVAIRPAPAKSAGPIKAFYFWTNCRNSTGKSSKPCASPWKPGASTSPAPPGKPNSRPNSS
jgi:hypothetical protein